MHEQTDSGGIISEAELDELTQLFQTFEGAQAPLAIEPQTAKQLFHEKVVALYGEKVKPHFKVFRSQIFLLSRGSHAESAWPRMTDICALRIQEISN